MRDVLSEVNNRASRDPGAGDRRGSARGRLADGPPGRNPPAGWSPQFTPDQVFAGRVSAPAPAVPSEGQVGSVSRRGGSLPVRRGEERRIPGTGVHGTATPSPCASRAPDLPRAGGGASMGRRAAASRSSLPRDRMSHTPRVLDRSRRHGAASCGRPLAPGRAHGDEPRTDRSGARLHRRIGRALEPAGPVAEPGVLTERAGGPAVGVAARPSPGTCRRPGCSGDAVSTRSGGRPPRSGGG